MKNCPPLTKEGIYALTAIWPLLPSIVGHVMAIYLFWISFAIDGVHVFHKKTHPMVSLSLIVGSSLYHMGDPVIFHDIP